MAGWRSHRGAHRRFHFRAAARRGGGGARGDFAESRTRCGGTRRIQRRPDETPLEENDYYLANKVAAAGGEQVLDQDRVVERLSQDSIVNALAEVPHDFRDVVVLVDIGDFSYADAAQILDIPMGTVMSRLHRGRRLLKARLADEAVG